MPRFGFNSKIPPQVALVRLEANDMRQDAVNVLSRLREDPRGLSFLLGGDAVVTRHVLPVGELNPGPACARLPLRMYGSWRNS